MSATIGQGTIFYRSPLKGCQKQHRDPPKKAKKFLSTTMVPMKGDLMITLDFIIMPTILIVYNLIGLNHLIPNKL